MITGTAARATAYRTKMGFVKDIFAQKVKTLLQNQYIHILS